jgi:DNA-binding PadR family transcriptional regulator
MRQVPLFRPDVERLLPLKPVAFQILLALADGARHGYAIAQEISNRTHTRMRVEPGNLYRSLKGLLDDGLIEEIAGRAVGDNDDERRRYYRLTPFGRRVAAAELTRLEAVVADARGKQFAPSKT